MIQELSSRGFYIAESLWSIVALWYLFYNHATHSDFFNACVIVTWFLGAVIIGALSDWSDME